jgi:uncharacterized protein with PQ loop repeat
MPELSALQIMLIPIVGVIVATLSILSKIFGLPDQIKKNFSRKSTEGLSLRFYLLSFITYFFWAIYGVLREDWVVFIAHGALGCLMTGMVLYQFFIYRSSRN